MSRASIVLLLALGGCGDDAPSPRAASAPVAPVALGPSAEVAPPEPEPRSLGTLPPEGETELVVCAIEVALDPDEALVLADVALRPDGAVIVASDGALLGFEVIEGRDCQLRPHPRFGTDGRIERAGLRADTTQLLVEAGGRLWVVGERSFAVDLDGTITDGLPPARDEVPGTTAADRVRHGSGGFSVLASDAPSEIRVLAADGALLRTVHAGATLDFALEVIAPGAGPAVLRGLSDARDRVAYASFETPRGAGAEAGLVRIAGL